MTCPHCKQKMTLKGEDFSYDFKVKPKQKYLRSVYHCITDDVWLTLEKPAKK